MPAILDCVVGVDRFRNSIMALQSEMLTQPQVDCPVQHYFASGVYVREVTIPAGSIVIGKIHRHATLNFLLKGEITVITEEGKRRLVAPCTFVSPPGTKKAAYTHTEVVWSNAIATDSTDVAEIERATVCDDYEDGGFLDHVNEALKLEGLCHS